MDFESTTCQTRTRDETFPFFTVRSKFVCFSVYLGPIVPAQPNGLIAPGGNGAPCGPKESSWYNPGPAFYPHQWEGGGRRSAPRQLAGAGPGFLFSCVTNNAAHCTEAAGTALVAGRVEFHNRPSRRNTPVATRGGLAWFLSSSPTTTSPAEAGQIKGRLSFKLYRRDGQPAAGVLHFSRYE